MRIEGAPGVGCGWWDPARVGTSLGACACPSAQVWGHGFAIRTSVTPVALFCLPVGSPQQSWRERPPAAVSGTSRTLHPALLFPGPGALQRKLVEQRSVHLSVRVLYFDTRGRALSDLKWKGIHFFVGQPGSLTQCLGRGGRGSCVSPCPCCGK